jgi:DNA-binding CsgD family transcriptional regulator
LVLACPLRGAIPEKIGRLGEPQAPVALFIEDPALGDAAQLNDMLTQFYRLTPAETRVATIFAAGFGTVGTSQHLAVSENTVKTHAKRIYEKMGLKSQEAAIAPWRSGHLRHRARVSRRLKALGPERC